MKGQFAVPMFLAALSVLTASVANGSTEFGDNADMEKMLSHRSTARPVTFRVECNNGDELSIHESWIDADSRAFAKELRDQGRPYDLFRVKINHPEAEKFVLDNEGNPCAPNGSFVRVIHN